MYNHGTKNLFRTGDSIPVQTSRTNRDKEEVARPFHGPYSNTARICPVDKPESEPILVALDWLCCCPEEDFGHQIGRPANHILTWQSLLSNSQLGPWLQVLKSSGLAMTRPSQEPSMNSEAGVWVEWPQKRNDYWECRVWSICRYPTSNPDS